MIIKLGSLIYVDNRIKTKYKSNIGRIKNIIIYNNKKIRK